jgi:glucose/arabinose dehydrogenase
MAGGRAETRPAFRNWRAAVVLCLAAGTAACTAPPAAPGPGSTGSGAGVSTVVEGLAEPWSIVFLPDGSALVSENDTGLIKQLRDGRTVAAVPVPAELETTGEGGLLGLAVSDDFAEDSRLFVYLTTPQDNRVLSYRWDDGELADVREVVTGIPKARIHNGGRLEFGPDGYLYISTGEAGQRELSQDRASLGGKILRVTRDGSPAPGNPFPNSPVYSYGHRNVQGMAWDSEGRMWASEFGPDRDDELNIIKPGKNYGWPEVTGAPGDSRFVDAEVVWPSTAEASPSGMAIVDDVAWLAALRGQRLWRVELSGGKAGKPTALLQGEYGRLRDVAAAPDGRLWVLTNGGNPDRIVAVSVK